MLAATELPGAFNGCVRQHRLVFGDGTVFACARTAAQTGYGPRVHILGLPGQPPSVVLVGSAVLAGELLRLKLHDYPVPLRMDPDPLPPLRPPTNTALPPTGAVPSIDTLTRRQDAPLSAQQDTIPVRPRRFHPSR